MEEPFTPGRLQNALLERLGKTHPIEIIGASANPSRGPTVLRSTLFIPQNCDQPPIFIIKKPAMRMLVLTKLGLKNIDPAEDETHFLVVVNGLVIPIGDSAVIGSVVDAVKKYVDDAAKKRKVRCSSSGKGGCTGNRSTFAYCSENDCKVLICFDCLQIPMYQSIDAMVCAKCSIPPDEEEVRENYKDPYTMIKSMLDEARFGGRCENTDSYTDRIRADDQLAESILIYRGKYSQQEMFKQIEEETAAACKLGGCNFDREVGPWIKKLLKRDGAEKVTLSWRRIYSFEGVVHQSDSSGNGDFQIVKKLAKCVTIDHKTVLEAMGNMNDQGPPGRIAFVARLHQHNEDLQTCIMMLEAAVWDGKNGLNVFPMPRLNGLRARLQFKPDVLTCHSGGYRKSDEEKQEQAQSAMLAFDEFRSKTFNQVDLRFLSVSVCAGKYHYAQRHLLCKRNVSETTYIWTPPSEDIFTFVYDVHYKDTKMWGQIIASFEDGSMNKVLWRFDKTKCKFIEISQPPRFD